MTHGGLFFIFDKMFKRGNVTHWDQNDCHVLLCLPTTKYMVDGPLRI